MPKSKDKRSRGSVSSKSGSRSKGRKENKGQNWWTKEISKRNLVEEEEGDADDEMVEESPRTIPRRRLRTLRNAAAASKKKAAEKDDESGPSAVAISTSNSTGIEVAPLTAGAGDTFEELSEAPSKQKKKKKSKSIDGSRSRSRESTRSRRSHKSRRNSNDNAIDRSERSGDDALAVSERSKKSKKKKKSSESVAESTKSLKSSTSKISSSMLSTPKKKKKSVKDDPSSDGKKSKRRKSKTGGKATDIEIAEQTWKTPKGLLPSKDSSKKITSSPKSPGADDVSKKYLGKDSSSRGDGSVSGSIASIASIASRFNLKDSEILGSAILGGAGDDNDVPFWKQTPQRERGKVNAPSLDELDDSDHAMKSRKKAIRERKDKYVFPKTRELSKKPSNKPEENGSSDDDAGDEDDDEPEWVRKKKMFNAGRSSGNKVAYIPSKPPGSPDKASGKSMLPSAPLSGDEEEKEEKKLPPWANAKKALKKTASANTSESSAVADSNDNNDNTTKDDSNGENDEQDKPKDSLPPWANARKSLKKTGSMTNANADNAEEEEDNIDSDNESDGEPEWKKKQNALGNRTAKSTSAFVPSSQSNEIAQDLGNESDGEPEWKKKQNALGNRTAKSTSAYIPPPPSNEIPEEDPSPPITAKPDNDPSNEPPWAKARKSLKPSGNKLSKTSPSGEEGPSEPPTKTVVPDTDPPKKPSWAKVQDDPPPPSQPPTKTVVPDTNPPKKPSWAKVKDDPPPLTNKSAEPENDNSNAPPWANAIKALKVSGNLPLSSAKSVDEDEEKQETKSSPPTTTDESDNDHSNEPAWVKARNALRTTSNRSLRSANAAEEEPQDNKSNIAVDPFSQTSIPESENDDSNEPPWAKARKTLKSSDNRSLYSSSRAEELDESERSGGVPLWAKKKKTSDAFVPLKNDDDQSALTGSVVSGGARMGKGRRQDSERSISGSASVTSMGSKDSQATNQSHQSRLAAYLEKANSTTNTGVTIRNIEYSNEVNKPPSWVKNRDQASSKKTSIRNPSATPRVSNKSIGGGGKEGLEGGSDHVKNADISSVGSLSVDDRQFSLEKKASAKEHEKDQYGRSKGKTWTVSSPVPAYAAGRMALKKVAPPEEKGRKEKPPLDRVYSSESLRKTATSQDKRPPLIRKNSKSGDVLKGAEHSQPNMNVNMVTDDVEKNSDDEESGSCENDTETGSAAGSLYKATQLKKVAPPDDSKWKAKKDTIGGLGAQLRKVARPDESKWKSQKDIPDSSGHSGTQLRKVAPPKEEKWKERKTDDSTDEDGAAYVSSVLRSVDKPKEDKWKEMKTEDVYDEDGAAYVSSVLRSVDKPNEQKWKVMKSADVEDEGYSTAYLKKVEPPAEKKWKDPNSKDETAGMLYDSQHKSLRRVSPPVEDKWKGKDAEDGESPPTESNVDDLQEGNLQEDKSVADSNSAGEFASDGSSVSTTPNDTDDGTVEKIEISDQEPPLTKNEERHANENSPDGNSNQDEEGISTPFDDARADDDAKSGGPLELDSAGEAQDNSMETDIPHQSQESQESPRAKDINTNEDSDENNASPTVIDDKEITENEEGISPPTTSSHNENRDTEIHAKVNEASLPNSNKEDTNDEGVVISDVEVGLTTGTDDTSEQKDVIAKGEELTPSEIVEEYESGEEVCAENISIGDNGSGEGESEEEIISQSKEEASQNESTTKDNDNSEDKPVLEEEEAAISDQNPEESEKGVEKGDSDEAEQSLAEGDGEANDEDENQTEAEAESEPTESKEDGETEDEFTASKDNHMNEEVEDKPTVMAGDCNKDKDHSQQNEISDDVDEDKENDAGTDEVAQEDIESKGSGKEVEESSQEEAPSEDEIEDLVHEDAPTASDDVESEESASKDNPLDKADSGAAGNKSEEPIGVKLFKNDDLDGAEENVQEDKNVVDENDVLAEVIADEDKPSNNDDIVELEEDNAKDDVSITHEESRGISEEETSPKEDLAISDEVEQEEKSTKSKGNNSVSGESTQEGEEDVTKIETCAKEDDSSMKNVDDAGSQENSKERDSSAGSSEEGNVMALAMEADSSEAKDVTQADESAPDSTVDENDNDAKSSGSDPVGTLEEEEDKRTNALPSGIDKTRSDVDVETPVLEEEALPLTDATDVDKKLTPEHDDPKLLSDNVEEEQISNPTPEAEGGNAEKEGITDEKVSTPDSDSDHKNDGQNKIIKDTELPQSSDSDKVNNSDDDNSDQKKELVPNANIESIVMESDAADSTRTNEEEKFDATNGESSSNEGSSSAGKEDSTTITEAKNDDDEATTEEAKSESGDNTDENADDLQNDLEKSAASNGAGASGSSQSSSSSEEVAADKIETRSDAVDTADGVGMEESEKIAESDGKKITEGNKATSGELLKILEKTGYLVDESGKSAVSLSSFFDKGQEEDNLTPKDQNENEKKANDNEVKQKPLRTHSNRSMASKSMSVKSLSDHLLDTSGKKSTTSPADEESSGGWSDDDSATIKSEVTDITYGTLGSAVIVDATALTSNADAAKKLRKMVAAKAAQSKDDIVPGPPPSEEPSHEEDILFTPPQEESDGSDSDNGGDIKKSNKKKKKKKPKKSKDTSSSIDRDIDTEENNEETKKKKDRKKKKEKKKFPTVEEDIVFDAIENAGSEDEAIDRTKKKKKKKKKKGDSGSE